MIFSKTFFKTLKVEYFNFKTKTKKTPKSRTMSETFPMYPF